MIEEYLYCSIVLSFISIPLSDIKQALNLPVAFNLNLEQAVQKGIVSDAIKPILAPLEVLKLKEVESLGTFIGIKVSCFFNSSIISFADINYSIRN